MAKLKLTVACWDYDRVRPLMDGRVQADGIDLNFLPLTPEEIFYRAFRHTEFEVSELSLSTTLMTMARGECPYTPIPVFPSRSFRHSCIYVRKEAGIKGAADLKGRRVGIAEYQVTAALVARGVLADEYGVAPTDLRWVQAGLEQPGREDKVKWTPPAGLDITYDRERSLCDLVLAGQLDAVITPRAPSIFRPDGSGAMVRLFPGQQDEAAYFRKTGIFPIMHLIGLRNDVAAAHPWAAVSLLKAFTAAKDIALRDLGEVAALKAALPFLPAYVTETVALMGADFWPYGLDANRAALEAATRWSFEQGLSARRLAPADLFPPATQQSFRV